VIAVLDLLGGKVVRGVAGRRHEYRPIQSTLTRDTSPARVAAALVDALPIHDLYVADLDAIAGGEPNWDAYHALAALKVSLWIDAGTGDAVRCRSLSQFSAGKRSTPRVVVGLESLDRPAALQETFAELGAERAVFSLDMKHGMPLCHPEAWNNATAESVAQQAVSTGFRRIIVLDLAHVGTGSGAATAALCRRLHAALPHVELISGGGVRCLADLHDLAEAGCSAALVASALHDGRLTAADLEQAAQWQ
jgi:phosphoribosylformimino-5-aminoimidazole carboxamide ribotide isomerase